MPTSTTRHLATTRLAIRAVRGIQTDITSITSYTSLSTHSTASDNFQTGLLKELLVYRCLLCSKSSYLVCHLRRSFVNCRLKYTITNSDNLPFTSFREVQYISSRSIRRTIKHEKVALAKGIRNSIPVTIIMACLIRLLSDKTYC